MSNTFGATASGFVPKLQADCNDDITTAMRQNVDPNLDMGPTQPIGQIASAVASELAELWELGAVCWSGLNPNNAQGFVLDADMAYTGVQREGEQFSTVIGTMTLNATTTVAAGSTANVSGQPTNTWILLGPADSTTGLLLSAGPVVSTSAGTYYGMFQATAPGPVLANAGQLTQITTAVSGWTAITNAVGCTLGSLVESDSAANVRRGEELAAAGGDTVDACVASLLALKVIGSPTENAVIQAFVYENDTDVVDSFSVPAHSMHVVVYDGIVPLASNVQIAQAIWDNKPSGTATYGGTSALATDSQGKSRTVNFDRATIVPVYISLTTTRGSTFDATNGPAAIGAQLVAYWATQQNLGVSMIARFISGSINNTDIQGLADVPTFDLGTSYPATATANLTATGLQVLTLNTGVDGSSHHYITVDGLGV